MKITLVVDKTESLARRNFSMIPGETFAFVSLEMFEAMTDEDKAKYEHVIMKCEKEEKKTTSRQKK